MAEFLVFILLGVMTYFIVQRSTANITKTPVWLLWLVLMIPAAIWMAWSVIVGADKPIPLFLMLGPFLLCPLLYWWLIQKGKLDVPAPNRSPELKSPGTESAIDLSKSKPATKIRPIAAEEEKQLRNCFPWGTYYLQSLDYHPQAIICRGKLRANPDAAYATVRENVEQKFGDRFLVVFQEGLPERPFFALVPNPRAKGQPRETQALNRPILALGLFLITLMTTTVAGVEFLGFSRSQWQADPALLARGLPYSLGLLSILGVRELSHYLVCLSYKLGATLPYFLPFPRWIGTLGAYTELLMKWRSPIPHRKALFDKAIAGPLAGFLVTIPLLLWGLSLSEVVPLAEQSTLLDFNHLDPRFSFLLAVASKLMLGNALTANLALNLHPIAIAGYLGLLLTAFDLMPVGPLNGGHLVHAMFGQRKAMAIGQIARLVVLALGIRHREFLIWALLLLFVPIADEPALNDITELDDRRDFLGLLALALLVVTILPLPPAIAQWWNF